MILHQKADVEDELRMAAYCKAESDYQYASIIDMWFAAWRVSRTVDVYPWQDGL